jgi:hypothetical protein
MRTPQIQSLMAQGAIQMSFLDEQDVAEITHPDYPRERLIVCRNPWLASERGRKRQELIAAAEKKLKEVEAATPTPAPSRAWSEQDQLFALRHALRRTTGRKGASR